MRVLYVCTANICRSASAEQLLRAAVAGDPELAGVEVRSAGTHAVPGLAGCSVAPALVGVSGQHRSQPLTRGLIEWADLILPAARDHRAAIVALVPPARGRTFTIRQAGRIASWLLDSGMVQAARDRSREAGGPLWTDGLELGDPRRSVEPMPEDSTARIAWLVGELDASRGMQGASPESSGGDDRKPARRWRLGRGRSTGAAQPQRRRPTSGDETGPGPGASPSPGWNGTGPASSTPKVDPSALHPDDVPDPHVLGSRLHPLAYEQLRSSTDALVGLLRDVSPA